MKKNIKELGLQNQEFEPATKRRRTDTYNCVDAPRKNALSKIRTCSIYRLSNWREIFTDFQAANNSEIQFVLANDMELLFAPVGQDMDDPQHPIASHAQMLRVKGEQATHIAAGHIFLDNNQCVIGFDNMSHLKSTVEAGRAVFHVLVANDNKIGLSNWIYFNAESGMSFDKCISEIREEIDPVDLESFQKANSAQGIILYQSKYRSGFFAQKLCSEDLLLNEVITKIQDNMFNGGSGAGIPDFVSLDTPASLPLGKAAPQKKLDFSDEAMKLFDVFKHNK